MYHREIGGNAKSIELRMTTGLGPQNPEGYLERKAAVHPPQFQAEHASNVSEAKWEGKMEGVG